jgi:Chromo (CHRromatin Organisation MOdifier) domain
MLSMKNLNLSTIIMCKLSPKWIGPFLIMDKVHNVSFKLDLKGTLPIHPMFHVSLLKPYYPSDKMSFPNHTQDPPNPLMINDQPEYEVEEIIKKRSHYGKTQYLVKWKGYD